MKDLMVADDSNYRYYYIRLYGQLDVRKVEGRVFNYLVQHSLNCRIISNEGKWLIYACRTRFIQENGREKYVDVLLCRKEKFHG